MNNEPATYCFACDRKLGKNPALIRCADEQTAYVGRECFKLIKAAGDAGWENPKGGPRLYLLETPGLEWFPSFGPDPRK